MTETYFAWNNYDDDPTKAIGVTTIANQKNGVYQEIPDGHFNGSMEESFFSNNDEMAGCGVSMVIGEEAKELVYGEGFVAPQNA